MTTMQIPTFISVAEHQRQVLALTMRIAELEQRPLIAVAPESERIAELEAQLGLAQAEVEKQKRLLRAVREVLRDKLQAEGKL